MTINVTYLGGGLGRKAELDFVSQAVQVGDGDPAPGQADVAARGRLHPRPVPADGAGARPCRARCFRLRRRLDLSQRLALDPRPARRRPRRHRRQPGKRGIAGAAVRLRRAPDRVGQPSVADSRGLLALGGRVDQHLRGRIDDRRARRGGAAGSVSVPPCPAHRPALARRARCRRRGRGVELAAAPGHGARHRHRHRLQQHRRAGRRGLQQQRRPARVARLGGDRQLPDGEPGIGRGADRRRRRARPERGPLRAPDLRQRRRHDEELQRRAG